MWGFLECNTHQTQEPRHIDVQYLILYYIGSLTNSNISFDLYLRDLGCWTIPRYVVINLGTIGTVVPGQAAPITRHIVCHKTRRSTTCPCYWERYAHKFPSLEIPIMRFRALNTTGQSYCSHILASAGQTLQTDILGNGTLGVCCFFLYHSLGLAQDNATLKATSTIPATVIW